MQGGSSPPLLHATSSDPHGSAPDSPPTSTHDNDLPPTDSGLFSPNIADHLANILPPAVYDFCIQNVGLALMAVAQFFFTCMNLTVKYFLTVTSVSIPTLIFVRMAITILGCLSVLYLQKDPHLFLGPPEFRRLLVIRGCAGFTGLFSSYMSFKGLKVSDSITIQFLGPTVTLILGYFILKETFKKREMVAGLACLAGVLFVSRPAFLFGSRADSDTLPHVDEGGSVVLSGQEAEAAEGRRMVAVGWASITVVTSSLACECDCLLDPRVLLKRSLQIYPSAILAPKRVRCTLCSTMRMPVLLHAYCECSQSDATLELTRTHPRGILFTPGPFVWVKTWSTFILIIVAGVRPSRIHQRPSR